jgi:hypothetical protein
MRRFVVTAIGNDPQVWDALAAQRGELAAALAPLFDLEPAPMDAHQVEVLRELLAELPGGADQVAIAEACRGCGSGDVTTEVGNRGETIHRCAACGLDWVTF